MSSEPSDPPVPDDPPVLLPYAVSSSPAPLKVSSGTTPVSGQIVVTLDADPAVLCRLVRVLVPIGSSEPDVFEAQPSPPVHTFQSTSWTVVSAPQELDVPPAPANYYSVALQNKDPDGKAGSFTLTISGTVNTIPTGQAADCFVTIRESSTPASDPKGFTPKDSDYAMTKSIPPGFYLRNFIARAPGTATLPATEFDSGASFELSWESNGGSYAIYQKGSASPIYSGAETSFTVPAGSGFALINPTTFVLVATHVDGQETKTLYETITLTVANPTLDSLMVIGMTSLPNAGRVGIGTTAPFSQLANTSDNILDSVGYGGNANSFAWEVNAGGYAGQFFNASTNGGSGLVIKVAATNAAALDVCQGTPAYATSTPLLRVTGAGKVGVGTTAPCSQLANTKYNMGGSDDIGGNLKTLAWAANSSGYVGQFFNGGTAPNSNGVAIKVALTTCAALDVSQGGQAEGAGTALFQVKGNGRVGVGTNAPCSQLANTSKNMEGSDGTGCNPSSLCWAANDAGYVGEFFNGGSASNANGIAVKVNSTSGNALDVSQGSQAGGAGNPLFAVKANGQVCVGTTTPLAKLHVSGRGQTVLANGFQLWANYQNPHKAGEHKPDNYRPSLAGYFDQGELWSNGGIVSGQATSLSDVRLKQVIGRSGGEGDLEKLLAIKVTDFTYIDRVNNPSTPVKKVIAQEVRDVLPEAVRTHTGAVPNVYEMSADVVCDDGRVTVRTTKPHELPATGGRMRLYTESDQDLHVEARAVDAHTFVFQDERIYERLFVYGKYVSDLLSVDYDAISVLGVSATQHLARQLTVLSEENASLRDEIRVLHVQTAQNHRMLEFLHDHLTTRQERHDAIRINDDVGYARNGVDTRFSS